MTFWLGLILGFIAGFFAAGCYFGSKQEKARRTRRQQRSPERNQTTSDSPRTHARDTGRDAGEGIGREDNTGRNRTRSGAAPGQESHGSRKPEGTRSKPPVLPPPQDRKPKTEEKAPDPLAQERERQRQEEALRQQRLAQERAAKEWQQRLEAYYRSFRSAGTLEVSFNYSFPESMLLRPGTGYLHSKKMELIPEKSVFTRSNTTMGYAMEGLFWMFDVIYEGEEYTFQDIMDGLLEVGYVRIYAVVEPALIGETGHYGHFKLVQKGKLEITDVK